MPWTDTGSGKIYSPTDGRLPRGVKWLLIANIALYLVYFVSVRAGMGALFDYLKLIPLWTVESFQVWQLATYMFLHSAGDPWHIVFNMFNLWMVGMALENTWGTRRFLKYYFVCGIGAGICVVVANYLAGTPNVATLGASGAIYGLLLAFGMLFPDAVILLIIFPVKARYGVMILGAIAFLMSFPGSGSTVSHIAHLGGFVVGYVYLRYFWGPAYPQRRVGPRAATPARPRLSISSLRTRYTEWKRDRARRKFQVYMRKHGSDRDRWVQ